MESTQYFHCEDKMSCRRPHDDGIIGHLKAFAWSSIGLDWSGIWISLPGNGYLETFKLRLSISFSLIPQDLPMVEIRRNLAAN